MSRGLFHHRRSRCKQSQNRSFLIFQLFLFLCPKASKNAKNKTWIHKKSRSSFFSVGYFTSPHPRASKPSPDNTLLVAVKPQHLYTHALLRISFRGNQATPEPCLSRKKLEAQNVLHARLYLIILISLNPQSFSAVPAFLLCSILARHIGDKGKGQARGIVGTKEERCTYRVGHIQVNLAMSASNDMAPYHGIAPSNTHPTHDTLRHIGSKNR